jgi:hypothetical protein
LAYFAAALASSQLSILAAVVAAVASSQLSIVAAVIAARQFLF